MSLCRGLLGCALAACVAAGAATAQTGEPAGQMRITEDAFYIGEIEGRGGLPDIGIALAFSRQSGRVVVCAATASTLSGTLQRVKRAIVVTESGTTILRGLHWAPNYPPGAGLVGQIADCQITRHVAPENPQFGFDLTRSRF